MGEQLGSVRRTHTLGNVTEALIDKEVVLMGWVQKRRNLGSLIFIDLRDREGIVQIVFDENFSKEAYEKAAQLRGEYVIAVTGTVFKRHSPNPNIKSGMIEVFVKDLKILSESQTTPIHIEDNDDA